MINDALSVSPAAIKLIKEVEELSLIPYDDQTGQPISEWCKGATIGFGHLIPENHWKTFKNGITVEMANDILDRDLHPACMAVKSAVVVPLIQSQFDACVLLAFNIGAARFRQSSAVRMINDPRAVTPYVSLESAWKAYNESQGKENDGLKNRRDCEWVIWVRGVYQRW